MTGAQVHYASRVDLKIRLYSHDLAHGFVLIDRLPDGDITLDTGMVLTTSETKQRFVPVVRIEKLGWMARTFWWWPFGRRQQLQVRRISNG